MLNRLLLWDESQEKMKLVAELGDIVNEQQIQERLDELIPSFSSDFQQVPDLCSPK